LGNEVLTIALKGTSLHKDVNQYSSYLDGLISHSKFSQYIQKFFVLVLVHSSQYMLLEYA